jgi:HPt (histidine-containing phosphotransfer) domain-containing protein
MSLGADFAQLAEDLSPDDVRQVLGVFENDVRRLAAALAAAAEARDAATFRRVAHGLAGAAGAVGAKSLEAACRAQMGRDDLDPVTLPAAAGKIQQLADAALVELAAFVAGLGGQSRRA